MKARVLETRRTPEGLKRRRYETPEGVRFVTIEVPVEVWSGAVRRDSVGPRLASWQRGIAVATTRARGLALLADGWKPDAVASELRVTASCVQRWRRGRR